MVCCDSIIAAFHLPPPERSAVAVRLCGDLKREEQKNHNENIKTSEEIFSHVHSLVECARYFSVASFDRYLPAIEEGRKETNGKRRCECMGNATVSLNFIFKFSHREMDEAFAATRAHPESFARAFSRLTSHNGELNIIVPSVDFAD